MNSHSGNEFSTIGFLEKLPSLENLTILGGVTESVVSVIISNHGTTLKQLSLPELSCAIGRITDFRNACPALKHLSITMSRTGGDAREVALYTKLGPHCQLRSLCLELDCSVHVGVEVARAIPYQDSHYTNEETRRTLVNCAIDSTLAADIFHRIANEKSTGSTPLQSVELNVVNAGTIVSHGSSSEIQPFWIWGHFTRTGMCSLDPRDDRRSQVFIKE